MENKKISYKEFKKNIDEYLERLKITDGVNEELNKEYLYQEIRDNLDLLKDEEASINEIEITDKDIILRSGNSIFHIHVEDEEKFKNIHVLSSKLETYNTSKYLVKDTALITLDKKTGDYTVTDNIRDVVRDSQMKNKNCSIYAMSKIRNFTKEGLQTSEVIMSSKRTIFYEEDIDFYSFGGTLLLSNSDHIAVAKRVYFDVINYSEINNKGNEIYSGYQELSNKNGYRKFLVKDKVLGREEIDKLSEEEIKDKLLAEKDKKIRTLLKKQYTVNREIFNFKNAKLKSADILKRK